MQPFKQTKHATIYQGDCVSVLSSLTQTVNMAFFDPPYFVSTGGQTCKSGKSASVDKGDWDKPMTLEEETKFTIDWLTAARERLDDNGTIWISGTHHNIFTVGHVLKMTGFRILNVITWFKSNAAPNLACKCFTHSTELIIWAAKSRESKYLFNYAEMKAENENKQMRDVWSFTPPKASEKTFGKHPTQKPIALLDRIVRASTKKGDLILDAFQGSGTTGVAAILNGRRYIGIDKDTTYTDLAIRRIIDAEHQVSQRLL